MKVTISTPSQAHATGHGSEVLFWYVLISCLFGMFFLWKLAVKLDECKLSEVMPWRRPEDNFPRTCGLAITANSGQIWAKLAAWGSLLGAMGGKARWVTVINLCCQTRGIWFHRQCLGNAWFTCSLWELKKCDFHQCETSFYCWFVMFTWSNSTTMFGNQIL